MAYFAPYIDGDGIHIPTYKDTLEFLISGYKSIFGEDLYLGEETQDYQALSLFAKCTDDLYALTVENYNSRNPNYASGDALDILLPLNAMSRKAATSSTAVLTLGGRAGTLIPGGSEAIDANGFIWYTIEDCELNSEGVGIANAACQTPGPITANAGEINAAFTSISGWNTVTNEIPATIGTAIETDAEVRARRKLSVSMKNNGTDDALKRALAALEDVRFVDLRVNDTNQVNELGIPGHSICALVLGRDFAQGEEELQAEWEQTVVEAIWKNKAPGVGTYGSKSGVYIDENGHENTIYFTVPTHDLVTVNVKLTPSLRYDKERIDDIIRNAIMEDINGLGVGTNWGVTLAYRDIYNAINEEYIPFVITEISGKRESDEEPNIVTVPCDFDKILYTDAEHIIIDDGSDDESGD